MREHRRLGLAPGRRGEDDRVLPVEDRDARLLLHGPEARPAEPGDDRLLQPRGEAGEDAHQTSSCGTGPSSSSPAPIGMPRSTCSSSGLNAAGAKPYSVDRVVIVVLVDQVHLRDELAEELARDDPDVAPEAVR